MQLTTEVLIEKLADDRVRVSGSGRFALSAEGANRDEAMRRFRDKVADDLAPDIEVATITLNLPDPTHPLLKHAGDMRDDPLYDEWQEAIERYRKQVDAELEASLEASQKTIK